MRLIPYLHTYIMKTKAGTFVDVSVMNNQKPKNTKGGREMKVFLGGTCSGWKWRDEFQKMLKCDYYNPMTHGWNEKDRQKEVYERKTADFVVYGITKGIKGVYSIAELIDDAKQTSRKNNFPKFI